MRTKLIAPLVTMALSGALLAGAAAPSSAATAAPAAAPAASSPAAPKVSFAPVAINQPGLVGTFTPTNFVNQNGVLTAVGTFTGTVTTATGVQSVTNTPVTSAVTTAASNGVCSILDLTLGPLHLNLLGLVVDLNQVHLTLTAVPGGGLLGNLLCGLSNALGGGQAGGLANLLNRLLGI